LDDANIHQSNAPKNWTDIVNGFVNASSVFYGTDDALVEAACENRGNCDIDQRAFKGIAVRSFGRATQAAPSVAEPINKMISASAESAAKNCEGSDEKVECRLSWTASSNSSWEAASASDGNLGEVLNALQAVQALLWPTIDITAAGAGNDSSKSTSTNATTSGSPSGSSSSASPTGAGATLATSFTLVLAVAFAAALSC
jgi:mannan endo-1,6-alpha-mannosidase